MSKLLINKADEIIKRLKRNKDKSFTKAESLIINMKIFEDMELAKTKISQQKRKATE